MHRDYIESITRAAGGFASTPEFLERFYALATEPLQDRIQDIYRQLGEAETQLDQSYQLGREAERAAILRMSQSQWFRTQADLEAAIRARGPY
jgi:hypothetical protein